MIEIKIFVSSPSDVGVERGLCGTVFDRLSLEFKGLVRLTPMFWEYEPMNAPLHFQEQLPRSSDADLCILLLWWRFGTPLPTSVAARPDGSPYLSGTEFEFEDAARSYGERHSPDIFVYRKTETPPDIVRRWHEIKPQLDLVEAFFARWFKDGGSFTGSFHEFAASAEFETALEIHLRKWLVARLTAGGVTEAAALGSAQWQGSPFRGLQAFDVDDALIFCGRTRETAGLLETLKRRAVARAPFGLVTGASGAGKSSLVRAGLLPLITRPFVIEGVATWQSAVFRTNEVPGDPIASLAGALVRALPDLANAYPSGQNLRALIEQPERLATAVAVSLAARSSAGQAARAILVADQLEELFTVDGVTDQDRIGFLVALTGLVLSEAVWVVATIRSDFYPRLVALGPVIETICPPEAVFELRPPSPAEIGEIIRKPAALAGLAYERRAGTGESLDDLMLEEAASNPEALPLLEFALAELLERAGHGRLLTFADYDGMGGLEGALTSRADAELEALPENAQATLPVVLSLLTRFDLDTGAITRRHASYDDLAVDPARRLLVDRFVEARLLVRDREADGATAIGMAHEAMLSGWARALEWVEASRSFLRWRARIAAAASLWREEGSPGRLLIPPGGALRDAAARLDGRGAELAEGDRAFITASRVAARRATMARRVMGAALGLAACVAAAAALWVWDAQYRIFTADFADTERRWGRLEGIIPFDRSDTGRRLFSARIERQGRNGPVVRVVFRAPDGTCPSVANLSYDMPFYETINSDIEGRIPCSVAWERRGEDLLIERTFDRRGRELHTLTSRLDDWFTDEAGERRPGTVTSTVSADGTERALASGASTVRYRLIRTGPFSGFAEEETFLDGAHRPRPNDSGTFGYRREWRTPFPSRTVTYLGERGEPRRERDSQVAGRKTDYAMLPDGGWTRRSTDFDEAGEVVSAADAVPIRLVRLDRDGRETERRDFDRAGRLRGQNWTLPVSGTSERPLAVRTWVWGDGPDLTSTETRLDASGALLPEPNGAVRTVRIYDAGGRLVRRTSFARDKKDPSLDAQLVELRQVWDADGELSESRDFGPLGEPKVNSVGSYGARYVYERDAAGLVTAESRIYLDPEGKPGTTGSGVARMRTLYDSRSRRIGRELFDLSGKPALGGFCWSSERQVLDVYGRDKELSFFDTEGRPTRQVTSDSETGTTMRYQYDFDGLSLGTAHFVDDDRLDNGTRGWARTSLLRDERGRLWRVAFYDAEGRPSLSVKDGYASATMIYDAAGNLLARDFVDPASRLVDPARLGARGDENFLQKPCGRATAAPVVGSDPARTEYTYADGRLTERTERWANGQSVYLRYHSSGETLEHSYLDPSGQLRMDPGAGFARERQTFDDRNRLTRRAYFNEQDRPFATSFGYSTLVNQYEEDGTQIQRLLDPNGVQIESPSRAGSFYLRIARPADETGMIRIVIERKNGDAGISFVDSQQVQRLHDGLHSCFQAKGRATLCRYRDERNNPIEQTSDIVVESVKPESGFAKAGLAAGAVVRDLDGRAFVIFEEFQDRIRSGGASSHRIGLERGGRVMSLTVASAAVDDITFTYRPVPSGN